MVSEGGLTVFRHSIYHTKKGLMLRDKGGDEFMVSMSEWKEEECTDAEEVERIVEKYYRLAFKIASKWVKSSLIEQDEANSLALLALMKCIRGAYNPKKGKFSTYLGRAVDNEIRMWLRGENKRSKILYFDDIKYCDSEGNEMSWLDSIKSSLLGPDESLGEKETLKEAIEIFERASVHMSKKERECIYLSVVNGVTHAEIGEVVGISQSYVSRLLRNAREKLGRERDRTFREWERI